MSLRDLEELVLRVRNDTPREYIREAVNAYQGGAIRSSVISTWIAVVFDIIEKMRELELTGDAQAQQHLKVFERAHQSGDISAALQFERSILDIARTRFEFISQQEYEDLSRLQVDRNRCAHPTMASDGVYGPSSELARYHIRSAVETLLQHPPVQGKKALDRLVAEVESPYFPLHPDKAKQAFLHGPLQRPKTSLVANFLKILLKGLLEIRPNVPQWLRHYSAWKAVQAIHGAAYEQLVRANLSEYIRQRGDALAGAAALVARDPALLDLVAPDVQEKLRTFVRSCPDDLVALVISSIIGSPVFRIESALRIEKLTPEQLVDLVEAEFIVPAEYVGRAIDLYVSSRSYSEANWRATKLIEPCIHELTLDGVRKILESISTNSQLLGARTTLGLLNKVSALDTMNKGAFGELLKEQGLDKHFPGIVQVTEEDIDIPF